MIVSRSRIDYGVPKTRRSLSCLGIVLSLTAMVYGQEPGDSVDPDEPESASADASEGEWPWRQISGYLSTRYRARIAGDEYDQDLFQYGSLDVGNPYEDRVTLSFSGRLAADLDGSSGDAAPPTFADIRDTWSGDVTAMLYHGWLDIHRLGPVERVRLGRQFAYDTPEFAHFDGISLETRKWEDFLGLRGITYAGVPVHPYESSPDNDMIVGVALESNPWRGSKLRLDWMHVRDDYVSGLQQDHLLAATFRQVLFDSTNLYARWTGFTDSNRDVTARIHQLVPDWDLEISASYRELFHTQRERAIEFDPYFTSLREYRPYRQAEIRASKLFGEHFSIDAGFLGRELAHDSDESVYNHEFLRWFVYPTVTDWPIEGMDITLFADFWDSQDDDIYSLGGEIELALGDSVELSLGSTYELYRYDFFDDRERDHVRTYYGRVAWEINESLDLRARYEFEDSEFDDFHTFMVEIRLSFGVGGER